MLYSDDVTEKLNSVSKTFCLSKYHSLSLYLQNGVSHSCYLSGHNNHNPLDKGKLKENLNHFSNTDFRKKIRKEMKDGFWPEECSYCEKIETLGLISERTVTSKNFINYFDVTKNLDPLTDDIVPAYIEVSFSNLCNMQCFYCGSRSSSKWEKDISDNGSYRDEYHTAGMNNVINYSENEYVDLFFKWLPKIKNKLQWLRITGGEPLLFKDFWRIFDYVDNSFLLSINTNLNYDKKILNRLILKLKEKNITNFSLFTSCDSWGKDIEKVRHGLNFKLWKENLEYLLNNTDYEIIIMNTVNGLSWQKMHKLFIYVAKMKIKFNNRLKISSSILETPIYMSIKNFPESLKNFISVFKYMNKKNFSETEKNEIIRIIETLKNNNFNEKKIENNKKILYKFINDFENRNMKNKENEKKLNFIRIL